MTKIIVRKNERSWAIEIITLINSIASQNGLLIKRAGGESTISYGQGKSMFPDVILYGDTNLTSILQGWELKMPDVAITDEAFVHDAQRKARALGLTSCVIWNFTHVKLYVLNDINNTFEVAKQWDNLNITSRQDVATYYENWKKTLEDVVLTVNQYLTSHKVPQTSIEDIISEKAINILINDHKDEVADCLKNRGIENAVVEAYLTRWWQQIKDEYLYDETDKYKAYAKNIILNWAYRIIFAHLIKKRQNAASIIDDLDYETTPEEANQIFSEITSKCDFYNVFEGIKLNDMIPSNTWNALVELSLFLDENGINNIDQTLLQNILEGSVNTTRRELNGQFTTPKILARILARITVHNWRADCGDPCCGTGTIPHEIIDIKKGAIGVTRAVDSTWASDKYQLPLQIANISMTSYDTMNKASHLFQKNAFDLKIGDIIDVVDPQDGSVIQMAIPQFGAICSNLPFVAFENIPDDDKLYTETIKEETGLSGKSDLSYYLVLHLHDLLNDDGYLGVIVSNSWLGTEAGSSFYHAILDYYDLKQVHISGKGRWFQNADVVTTILLLHKKAEGVENGHTSFFIWKQDLKSISASRELEEAIVNSSLLDSVENNSVVDKSEYTPAQIEQLTALNISYNALFHEVLWLLDLKDVLMPISQAFHVIRGSRRGWDPLFFPKVENNIEQEFIKPALFNARNITSLIAEPDTDAFSCSASMATLEAKYPGAYNWIKKFETEVNGKGKPLPKVLKRTNEEWYEMKPNEIVDFFTMMNPDTRMFFGRFREPTFINQRLIGLRLINPRDDAMLYHALLNSVLMKFYIEAVGFGRGLGVLDINKNSISKCFMLNPSYLTSEQKEDIKRSFNVILGKEIMTVRQELADQDWIEFNHVVLRAFGIDAYYDSICHSLLSMMQVRATAVEKKKVRASVLNIGSGRKYTSSPEVDRISIAAEQINPEED